VFLKGGLLEGGWGLERDCFHWIDGRGRERTGR
jgi:hypothetical protein